MVVFLFRALCLATLPLAGAAAATAASDVDAIVNARGGEIKIGSDEYLEKNGIKLPFNVTDGRFDHGANIASWVNMMGGSVHNDVDIRLVELVGGSDFHDGISDYRIFATADIPKGTPLMELPKETIITAEGSAEDKQCRRQQTARNLLRELQLGVQSQYAPYVQYLLDVSAQPKQALPTAAWSPAGKSLLKRLLIKPKSEDEDDENKSENEDEENKSENELEDVDLPPEKPARGSLLDALHGDCDLRTSDMTPDALHTFLLLHQRSWTERNDLMIPLYDMLQHGRGESLNTELEVVESEEGELLKVVIKTSRYVEAGEELHGSYHGEEEDYGTPELFRDYGFVESYPQKFVFHGSDVQFLLDKRTSLVEAENSGHSLFVKWLNNRPYDEDVDFLKKQLKRLVAFGTELVDRDPNIPVQEWDVILQYFQALVTAIDEAIDTYDDVSTCIVAEGTCVEFDELKEKPDKLDYNEPTCDAEAILKFPGYKNTDFPQSQYQSITFFGHNKTKDTCFDLDGTVQICSSYRPHYHEMSVHWTARYLDKVERVLFVGGGDAMLLHEILKYDSLQKVVGLELDQKVTRSSFKHFGTQPHWESEKVEWWFGDASKSLNMLPKDYFGSFDLVIVDLSETVMSFTVTKQLDIFGALALLLKPEGIIVKNEIYLEKFASLFDYTMQARLGDTPVVCSQMMAYGSYENDFIKRKPTNHGIETLLMDEVEELRSDHGIWHDYRKNTSSSLANCKDVGEEPTESTAEPKEQTSGPGIIMVVEVEDTKEILSNPESLKSAIVKTIEEMGFTVVSDNARKADSSDEEDNAVVSIVLEEGYITLRTWPNRKYGAFDIHLWAKFEKQDMLEKALVATVGNGQGKASSAYRIVAGGMFGVGSWQEDETNRGPRLRQSCSRNEEAQHENIPDQATIDTILRETLEMVDESNITVAVMCGLESETCNSLNVTAMAGSVGTVVPVWACPELEDLDLEEDLGVRLLRMCKAEVFGMLQESTKDRGALRAIVLDENAPRAMGQVLVRLFSDAKEHLLPDDGVLVVSTMKPEEESWRRALIDRFRQDIIVRDPVFRVQAFFNDSASGIELGLASAGDTGFIARFKEAVAEIEQKTQMVADIRNIQGGMFAYQPDFNPTHVFHPTAYDNVSPLEQWESQEPLGFQTLFQLELKPWQKYTMQGERVNVHFEAQDTWESGTLIERCVDDGDFCDVRLDDGNFVHDVHPKYMRADVPPPTLNSATIRAALASALQSIEAEEVMTQDFEKLGEGLIAVTSWLEGDVTVLWDGRQHIDVNLFTYEESIELAEEFVQSFTKDIPAWGIALRDEQPRGVGRVVSFQSDLKDRRRPHWAP